MSGATVILNFSTTPTSAVSGSTATSTTENQVDAEGFSIPQMDAVKWSARMNGNAQVEDDDELGCV